MRPPATSAAHLHARRFGRFELDVAGRQLLEDGRAVALGARAFDLLAMLVEQAPRLVTKNELLEVVWAGVIVEENNLQVQVSSLRRVLGQDAIATIPGRGYRLAMPVARVDAARPESLGAHLADTPLSTPGPDQARTNLPAGLSTLFGRADEIATIKALLRQHAVVTIVGAGGIGKTRVAQAVAATVGVESQAEFPDGIWWIELAALSDGAYVPSAVARALGRQLSPDRSALEAVAAVLAPHRLLLVLDNCEHLTSSVAELVASIRASAAHVRILATSREPLRTADEQVFRVGGLEVPEGAGAANATQAGAIELFAARAKAGAPRFTLTPANAPAVIEICRRLDGIPLAIELAAARVPLLGVEGLRSRLHERFNVLTVGARGALRRHQTLRLTLQWSLDLLTPAERTAFRRLGVFAGSFTLEAAQHVLGDEGIDPWSALDHLGALIDKSLVLAEGDPVPRYRMLETTRAYALERLAEAGETERAQRKHAEAMLALLAANEHDDRRWRKSPEDIAADAAELDNLRAALAWSANAAAGADLVVSLAGASKYVWSAADQHLEGIERLLHLRPHVDDRVDVRAAAGYWLAVATLGMETSEPRESFEAAKRAADLYRSLGDDSRCYDALVCVAAQCPSNEEREEAIAEMARLECPDWPARQRGGLLYARCWLFARVGRYEEALACAQRHVALTREAGQPHSEQIATANVVAMELLLGRLETALRHARTAIARLDALSAGDSASLLHWLAMIALILLDRCDEAVASGRVARALLAHEGDEVRMLSPLALLAAAQGRAAAAALVIGCDDTLVAQDAGDAPPVEAMVRSRVERMLEVALPAADRARLRADGAALDVAHALRIGFGDDV